MSQTIYRITLRGEVSGTVLSKTAVFQRAEAATENGALAVDTWWLLDPQDFEMEPVTFAITGTGMGVPDDWTYLGGTARDQFGGVWHVWRKP